MQDPSLAKPNKALAEEPRHSVTGSGQLPDYREPLLSSLEFEGSRQNTHQDGMRCRQWSSSILCMVQLCAWGELKKFSRLTSLLYSPIFTGEEMREARALAKQVSAEDRSALTWDAHDIPQPLSEATVSSYRQQQKLAGLLLQSSPPEPLPLVCKDPCLRHEMPSRACKHLQQFLAIINSSGYKERGRMACRHSLESWTQ